MMTPRRASVPSCSTAHEPLYPRISLFVSSWPYANTKRGFLSAFPSPVFRANLEASGYVLSCRTLPRGTDVETVANCKAYVVRLIGIPKYEPTTHQPALTGILPFNQAMCRRSPSFARLLTELDSLMQRVRRHRS